MNQKLVVIHSFLPLWSLGHWVVSVYEYSFFYEIDKCEFLIIVFNHHSKLRYSLISYFSIHSTILKVKKTFNYLEFSIWHQICYEKYEKNKYFCHVRWEIFQSVIFFHFFLYILMYNDFFFIPGQYITEKSKLGSIKSILAMWGLFESFRWINNLICLILRNW